MKYPGSPDVAAMKARGCNPSTIAEAVAKAEEQSKLRVAALQVSQTIEAAFAGVTLGGGIGLQEAQGLDDYADPATRAAYRANDEKDDWRRIPAEALQRCNSSLCFFDAEGMRFHLPAYLIADLHGGFGFGLAFSLAYLSEHTLRQFTLFSPPQRAAVRIFLLHILEDADYEFERPHIVRALAEFWTDSPST